MWETFGTTLLRPRSALVLRSPELSRLVGGEHDVGAGAPQEPFPARRPLGRQGGGGGPLGGAWRRRSCAWRSLLQSKSWWGREGGVVADDVTRLERFDAEIFHTGSLRTYLKRAG